VRLSSNRTPPTASQAARSGPCSRRVLLAKFLKSHHTLAFTGHALAVDYRVGSVFTVLLKAGSASFKAHLSFVFRPVQVFICASKVFLL
jgi:hypothetical protein